MSPSGRPTTRPTRSGATRRPRRTTEPTPATPDRPTDDDGRAGSDGRRDAAAGRVFGGRAGAGEDGAVAEDPGAGEARRRPVPRRRVDPAAVARAHRRRGLRRLAVLLAGVAALVGVGYLVVFSSVFGARAVDVQGAVLLTVDEVRAAAAVPPGSPLVRLDIDAVADRVRVLPPVAGVEVLRSWPSTLTLRVTERVPVAYLPVPQGARLVDRGGLEFATVATPPAGVPELAAGNPAAVTAAAAVLDTLDQPGRETLRAAVLSVRADTAFDIQFVLTDERTVRWGSAADSDRKAAVVTVLLSQPGSVYDVASPDLPTIR